ILRPLISKNFLAANGCALSVIVFLLWSIRNQFDVTQRNLEPWARSSGGRGYGLTGSAPTYAASMRSKPFADPLRQLSANDSDMGSGKMSSCSFSTPSKMARATDSGEAFGT